MARPKKPFKPGDIIQDPSGARYRVMTNYSGTLASVYTKLEPLDPIAAGCSKLSMPGDLVKLGFRKIEGAR